MKTIADELAEALNCLLNASAPYRTRKKETPRHECDALNIASLKANVLMGRYAIIKQVAEIAHEKIKEQS